jgi:cytochrome c oxidase assembly protein subunit 11
MAAVNAPLHASAPAPRAHGPLIRRCLLAVALAGAFGYALVPLYDTLCRAIGLNGKTFQDGRLVTATTPPAAAEAGADLSRKIAVEFTATVMPGLDWEVRPLTHALEMHPGELHSATFLVHNRSSETVTAQAVPSVTPGQAAAHFSKIECFCFTQQTLLPGEAREMPVAFIVKPELSGSVSTITLAYAFFPAPATAPATSPQGTRR